MKSEKLDIVIGVRLTKSEAENIKKQAKQMRISTSKFIAQIIREYEQKTK